MPEKAVLIFQLTAVVIVIGLLVLLVVIWPGSNQSRSEKQPTRTPAAEKEKTTSKKKNSQSPSQVAPVKVINDPASKSAPSSTPSKKTKPKLSPLQRELAADRKRIEDKIAASKAFRNNHNARREARLAR